MHLSQQHGYSVELIKKDGIEIDTCLESYSGDDSPFGIAQSMSNGISSLAEYFRSNPPDIMILLGDRYEMMAAACAAVPYNIIIAHIHGGELTYGAMDDCFRHAITKMSHIHFTSTDEYRNRVIQLGEDPSRVFLVGAPALEHFKDLKLIPENEIKRSFQLKYDDAPLLVTFHPVTREIEETDKQLKELLSSLKATPHPLVVTLPNADTYGSKIRTAFQRLSNERAQESLVENFGITAYFSMMHYSKAMIGNSSSGIIEAASIPLAVVNIGTRQAGRVHGKNVIDVSCNEEAISKAINTACSQSFQASIRDMENPYFKDDCSERIARVLASKEVLNKEVLLKSFYDLKENS